MPFARIRSLLLVSAFTACSADAPGPVARPAHEPQPEAAAPEEPARPEPEPVASPVPSAAPPAPTASSSAVPEAAPGYPLERVASTLRGAKDRFLVCAELESTSSVAALRFEIDEQGKVTEANYWRGDAPIKPDARQACSLVVLRSLSFPPSPKGKLTITYPLIEDAL